MANQEQLALLKAGVYTWNSWRANNLMAQIHLIEADLIEADLSEADLSRADLSRADLSKADLNGADLNGTYLDETNLHRAKLGEASLRGAYLGQASLSGANLRGVDLRKASLSKANLSKANLSEANLSEANLNGSDLYEANLSEANLSKANLSEANLSKANLSGIDLSGANLFRTQLLATNLELAIFTGACLKDWNTNRSTNLEGAHADYVYLDTDEFGGFADRRPHSGNFKPGEFAALFQQAIDTLDLIFIDGIDWQAFFASFQDLCQEYSDAELNIQAIEKKGIGSFVVRLEMSEDTDKAAIEQAAKTGYEQQLQLIEACYQAQLQLKDAEIESHKRESANMLEIAKLLANKPITVEAKVVSSSEQITTNIEGSTIGSYAGKLEGNASQNVTQYITTADLKTPAEAAKEIHDLLVQLAKDNPLATDGDRAEHLRKTLPPTRLQRSVELLQSAGEAVVESLPGGKVVTAVLKKVREQEEVQRKAQS